MCLFGHVKKASITDAEIANPQKSPQRVLSCRGEVDDKSPGGEAEVLRLPPDASGSGNDHNL